MGGSVADMLMGALTTGFNNIALGYCNMKCATTGCNNIGLGLTALAGATLTGINNIAIGCFTMDALTTGCYNTAVGQSALGTSTTGCYNLALGHDALAGADTTGANNIALGTNAADALTSGACNIALGINALGASSTGCHSIAIGDEALGTGDVTALDNIAIGARASCVMTSGNYNIAIGRQAMRKATNNVDNIAIGRDAMGCTANDGNFNIAFGMCSMGGGDTSGAHNFSVGHSALRTLTSGSHNVGIGYQAGDSVTTEGCVINIGCGVDNTTAGTTCIGGTCLKSACFYETSDCRSKCKIKDLPYGLSFINLLRPVSYKWKPQPDKLDKDGNLIAAGEKSHTGPRSSFGLLGQEVKGALDKLGLGYNDFGAYSDQEYENRNNPDWKMSYTMEDKTVGLSYVGFIAPLIKAVQELSTELTELKSKLKTT